MKFNYNNEGNNHLTFFCNSRLRWYDTPCDIDLDVSTSYSRCNHRSEISNNILPKIAF